MNESITSLIPWAVVLLVVVLAFFAMSREKKRLKNRTSEDFERDVARSKGSMLAASARGLEMVIGGEEKHAAIEYKKDMEDGVTKTGSKGDDEGRTATE